MVAAGSCPILVVTRSCATCLRRDSYALERGYVDLFLSYYNGNIILDGAGSFATAGTFKFFRCLAVFLVW